MILFPAAPNHHPVVQERAHGGGKTEAAVLLFDLRSVHG